MTKPIFRTKYEPRIIRTSMKSVKSVTDPQYLSDCSVEGIILRYGVLPRPDVTPMQIDVSQLGDFSECLNRIEEAKNSFMELPSNIRERFGNDPRSYYQFICNPNNVEECIKLGIMSKRVKEKTPVEVLEEIKDAVTAKAEI